MYAIRSYYDLRLAEKIRIGPVHDNLRTSGVLKLTIAALLLAACATDPVVETEPKTPMVWPGAPEVVITSYSIHYTKLYEWILPIFPILVCKVYLLTA